MKPLFHIITLSLLATALVAQEAAEVGEEAGFYPKIPDVAALLAVQTAEANAFPTFTDPGNPVEIAQSAGILPVSEVPVNADPVELAMTIQPPAVALPSEAADPLEAAHVAPPPAVASPGAAGNPLALVEAFPTQTIAPLAKPSPPDLFTINRLFNWDDPHGQWMNQLLKDIDAAKKTGDTERYTALTERYSAWAEKYLRRDDPPNLDGTPGR
jgi:hypothetical protein